MAAVSRSAGLEPRGSGAVEHEALRSNARHRAATRDNGYGQQRERDDSELSAPMFVRENHHAPPPARVDAQTQETVRSICAQMRHSDFRERIDAIEQ